ncbi:MAG: pyridoxine 5'-phosphate synthase [Candidatus Omnitrophica bacterium]|nr:pyridoxine 5'-phosphate synthase [Candidatus Omnitrophota bacterium]
MVKLGVNIDHVATLRQARRGTDPEPVLAALTAEAAGADSVVVHLREDRRHIQDRDVRLLRQVVRTRLNLEMSTAAEIVRIAALIKPDQATLVPERRQELTTEGGLDVVKHLRKVQRSLETLQDKGIEVSLFIDPDNAQIDAARRSGARVIELHTGRYADARREKSRLFALKQLREAALYARSKGLVVNAGHGLDYHNVGPVSRLEGVHELNIGYSIICRSVITGLDRAVREMKGLINP